MSTSGRMSTSGGMMNDPRYALGPTILERIARLERQWAELVEAQVTPACRAYRASAQTIPSGTGSWTAIQFDNESYDTHGQHDNVTNNTRLTAAVKGIYHIGCAVEWAFNATGYRWVAIRLNGSVVVSPLQHPGAAQSMMTCVDYALSAGQYAECVVMQNSGGDLAVQTSVAGPPRFWWHKVG